MRVPFIRDGSEGGFLVGAADDDGDYVGPVAEVYTDRDWVRVETDPYEGHAMLNIEALPLLIEALQRLQARLAPSPSTP